MFAYKSARVQMFKIIDKSIFEKTKLTINLGNNLSELFMC